MSALTFTACSDDNEFTYTQPAVSNTDVYVACAGNWHANDGTVGILDYNSESASNCTIHSTVMLIELRMVTESVTHKT